jgi:hypothetical protein
MTIGMMLGIMLAFGIGSYAGRDAGIKEAAKEKKVLPAKPPDVWPPVDHQKLLKTCGVMCGEGKLKSYNSIHGKCECKK